MIFTSERGRSLVSHGTEPMRFTTSMPVLTLPNIVCLPSSHGVGANVKKNCDPFVLGPALAIERIPAPVCLSCFVTSSSNFPPYIELPPLPVPVGSPVCAYMWQSSVCCNLLACRATASYHEVLNHAVEHNTIVISSIRQFKKISTVQKHT
eukprot:SAG31_NODE_1865_length_7034_cov_1.932805_4_plen_151_part_00